MIEYRMTRPDMYDNPGCPGHKDLSARQGYYIVAECEKDAHIKMRKQFPTDSHFDLQVWKKDMV